MKTLRDITYYKTGGTFRRLLEPRNREELAQGLRERDPLIPMMIIGAGSNTLVLDEAWEGDVLSLGFLNTIDFLGQSVQVGAGVENSFLAKSVLEQGFIGLGFMYGLPGQVGGTVRMNARCYGSEMADVTTRVHAFSIRGEEFVFDAAKNAVFKGYKDTLFMQRADLIIYQVEMAPQGKRSWEQERSFMEEIYGKRKAEGQYDYPSAGCVFKNNYGIGVPSGLLLEHAGAKSLCKGAARVSPHHANFIYNLGGATSSDILELSLEMKALVEKEFGLSLEYEMEIMGSLDPNIRQKMQEKTLMPLQNDRVDELRKLFQAKRNAAIRDT